MDLSMEAQAEMLANKVKHYLITMMGVTVEEASEEEFYRAFSLTLREEVMINWTAMNHTIKEKKARVVYYLCMEYMPGKFSGNNITNVNALPLVQCVLKKLGREYGTFVANEPEPGLGNGGLGRLAACFLDSLATQRYPAVGYGLRYQYGIFEQEIWGGDQVERPETWLLNDHPWEFRRDVDAVSIHYGGEAVSKVNRKGVEVDDLENFDEVRAIPYDYPIIGYRGAEDFNIATLRLWTTKESPRNFQLQRFNAGQYDQAAENTLLTDVLYPNDNHENGKRIRLKQEYLLSSASIQDIIVHHLRNYPDISNFVDKVRIQLNDTHPALAVVDLMYILLKQFDYDWGEAWETVKTCCGFTNHTVLKEAMEEWNTHRLEQLFPAHYKIIERLNLELCNAVRAKYPGDEDKVQNMSIIEGGQVRMANLSIYCSHKVNGVAALHSEIIKSDIFPEFYQMYPDKFVNVTNGVTPRRWILHCNPKLAAFFTERIGNEWVADFKQIQNLAKYASDPKSQQEFLAIKRENKKNLVEFLRKQNPLRDNKGNVISYTCSLDEDALFDIHIKRIHEYKRQLMNALHTLIVYQELQENPDARKIKRMVIFGGKAAPGYMMARKIIHFIYCLMRAINNDDKVNQKLEITYVENYNVSKAELLIPAADLSEQISTAGMEASGTGNMKMSMNGALTIGTEDGSNVEMRQHIGDQWWPFSFGNTSDQNFELKKAGTYNAQDIYNHNEKIHRALNALKDHSLAKDEAEHQMLQSIYYELLESHDRGLPDRYFVLNDLQAFYDTQLKVEELYLQPEKWAEYALHNIAGMGTFSTDESIHNYARLVWDLEPLPVDPKELARVREEYSEHDKCRILPA